MQQYNNEFIRAAISASVSVCFIANISVIGISVNLLIGTPLNLYTMLSTKLLQFFQVEFLLPTILHFVCIYIYACMAIACTPYMCMNMLRIISPY